MHHHDPEPTLRNRSLPGETVINQPSSAKLLLVCCVVSFACFFASYMRIPVLPLFAAKLGAGAPQVGAINATFMLTAGCLSIPAGMVADRWGRKLPLLGGLLILAGSSFALYLSGTLTQMAVIYCSFGIGLAAFAPTLMSYVADITPPESLGRAYGWYTMSLYAGMTLGPAVGGFIGRELGLRQVFLVSGMIIFLLCLLVPLVLPLSLPGRRAGETPSFLPALAGLGKNRQLIACLVATLGSCIGFGVFMTFMPLYATAHGLNSGHVGMIFASQALANCVSRFPFGRLSDRMADRSILVVAGLVGFAVALAACGLCVTLVPLMVWSAVLGIGMGIAYTGIGALITVVTPPALRGVAMGCYNSSIYFGMMLGSLAMGVVIGIAGFRSGFLVAGVTGLLVAGAFFLLFRTPHRGRCHPSPRETEEAVSAARDHGCRVAAATGCAGDEQG
jgi:MFS family permease